MAELPRIAVLMNTGSTFERELLRGFTRYSHTYSPWSYYPASTLLGKRKSARDILKQVSKWRPDGIITRFTDCLEDLIEMDLPTVLASWPVDHVLTPKIAFIHGDYYAVGKMAADHLVNLGFRHFAYCGYADLYWSELRGDTFGQFLAEHGHDCSVYRQPRSNALQYWDKEQHYLTRWLQSLPKPVAILACNDMRGQHVIEACKLLGLSIPFEVSILGVENDELICETSTPTLSSIARNSERAGYDAAKTLNDLMKGTADIPNNIIVHPTHVVDRISTEYMAVRDNDLVDALRFIRFNTNNPIQVDDVVHETHVSRRVLESKFRKFVKRSINQEIRRVRVDSIAQMLVDTEMNMLEIAHASGFNSVDHIARYFRQEKNMSPREYRKQYAVVS